MTLFKEAELKTSPKDAFLKQTNLEDIKNPRLKEFLTEFNTKTRDFFKTISCINFFEVPKIFSEYLGLEPWIVAGLRKIVDQYKILDLDKVKMQGSIPRSVVNQQNLAAFAAICWSFKESGQELKSAKEFLLSKILESTKEAFGEHAQIARLINIPNLRSERKRMKKQRELVSWKNYSDEIDKFLINLDQDPFFKTGSGKQIKELVISTLDFEDIKRSPIRPIDIINFNKLNEAEIRPKALFTLGLNDILLKIPQISQNYVYFPEHVIIIPLIFIHLERGYNLKETFVKVKKDVLGSNLANYLGEMPNRNLRIFKHQRYFSSDSPWQQINITPKSPKGNKRVIYNQWKQNPTNLITQSEIKNSFELKTWDQKKIFEEVRKVPNNLEIFNFTSDDKTKLIIINFAMFAKNGQRRRFDHQIDDITFNQFRTCLINCLKEIQTNPQLNNLHDLAKLYKLI